MELYRDFPHAFPISSLDFSRKRSLVAHAINDTVFIDGLRERTCSFRTGGTVRLVKFSPDGRFVAIALSQGSLGVWDVRQHHTPPNAPPPHFLAFQVARLQDPSNPLAIVKDLTWSPDSKYIVTGSSDNKIRMFDPASSNPLKCMFDGARSQAVSLVRFSKDGKYLVCASGKTGYMLSPTDLSLVYKMEGHSNSITCLSFSLDCKRAITGSLDGTARIWDLKSGRRLITLSNNEIFGPVTAVEFSFDGTEAMFAATTVSICNSHTGQIRVQLAFEGQSEPVQSIAYGPRDLWVIGESSKGEVCIWDARTGRKMSGTWGTSGVSATPPAILTPDGNIFITVDGSTMRFRSIEYSEGIPYLFQPLGVFDDNDMDVMTRSETGPFPSLS